VRVKNFLIGSVVLSAIVLLACQPFAGSSASGAADKTSPSATRLVGIWMIEQIGERNVIDDNRLRIQFTDTGKVNGHSSCNRFFGEYVYAENKLDIKPLGSTRMMCLPTLMEQEQRLLEQLQGASQARIEGNYLILADEGGAVAIRASREAAEQ
jgi:heat shock protein HslJ